MSPSRPPAARRCGTGVWLLLLFSLSSCALAARPRPTCAPTFYTIVTRTKQRQRRRLPDCTAAPGGGGGGVQAAAAAVSASALSTAYPCAVGDALCYCKWRGTLGYYADNDPAVGCKSYFWCYAAGSSYFTCQTGLLFDEKNSVCNWPANTVCPAPGPQPPTAAASPPTPVTSRSSPPPIRRPPPPGGKPPSPRPPSPKPPSPKPPFPKPPAPRPPPPRPPPPSPVAQRPPPPKASAVSAPPPAAAVASPPPSLANASLPPPQAARPPPPATEQPACLGDAACYCLWRADFADPKYGKFADRASGCQNWFWCVEANAYYYMKCQTGLRFNEATQACDWPENVQCVSAPSPPPSPPSPPPSPPASPPPPSPPPSPPSPPSPPGPAFSYGGYYESWSDPWKGSAATHRLATLPAYVDLVYLSFMYPDATYTGGVTWAGTGIQFSSDPAVVKGAVALLKQRNPRTKVLVAVGGATYTAWDKLNAASIKRFVDEFGLDGVDIDYEPSSAGCSFPPAVPAVRCSIDAEFTRVVTALRSAFPAPRYLLTSAVWSIGAYGQGAWVNSQPQGDHTGQSVNMLSAFGDQLDILNVMSYDAGPTYKPKEALDAYRSLFKGRILMGVEVPPEAWGGHVITVPETQDLAAYVKSAGGDGIMLWSLQKSGTPSAQALSTAVCNSLGLAGCADPLWP